MTRVAIIHSCSGISAKALQTDLKDNGIASEVFRPYLDGVDQLRNFTHVFSLGCSASTFVGARLNTANAVKTCVDKVLAFNALKAAKVNTVEYATVRGKVPKKWDHVVVRKERGGKKAEGYDVVPNSDNLPPGELYTEYFYHKYEYRVVVFNDTIVGRYYKKPVDGNHIFTLQPARGFELIDDHCLRAAKAIGIDYVGFDVVTNNKKDFRILEANSGATLTEEALNAIVGYYLNV